MMSRERLVSALLVVAWETKDGGHGPWNEKSGVVRRRISTAQHQQERLSLSVFSSKLSLSKLHYSPITSNLLPHAWSIKYK